MAAVNGVDRNDFQPTGQLFRDHGITASTQQGAQQITRKPNDSTNQTPNSNNNNPNQADEGDAAAEHSWYRRIAEKYGTLELDNKGSVARDHLALERTFLAWLRTSLSFASIGIAVTQLFRLNSSVPCTNPGPTSQTSLSDNANNVLQNSIRSSPSLLEVLLAPPPSYSSSSPDTIDVIANTATTSGQYGNIGKPLGATFIGIAILILIIGFHRYFESQYWIVRGKFPASRGSVALVAFVAAGLVIASFVVILVIAPTAREL
ncbi:conserved hypothetical protein [Talaromyces stipitatus ATCC 10500]|uniref:DUF202 domain-containing protein n=1 Tax=Talaromyces stipitatus (strain ATCC 10500 / CBS 375.48 / QM 6759 / NRRL 1006) TaxID=441959 RepID=B8M253_TALSN|nr:uncharacterized protein TSTA_087530 [Talaromyces stipitatus ATCC 10500]EED21517.1 conserved hypothetical protein [Talaromyces stipitatus ATCC 10500]